jgi:Fur family ferric uptake transcriptional regulator
MSGKASTDWAPQALAALRAAGYQRGGARTAVVEFLGREACARSALEIEDELRAGENAVGRASIYRALEQLEELGLVRRLEMGTGTASYERIEPSGAHHHHLLCAECGRVVPFEDEGLERAIARLSGRHDFEVAEHDIVLRGRCSRCA